MRLSETMVVLPLDRDRIVIMDTSAAVLRVVLNLVEQELLRDYLNDRFSGPPF